MSLFNKKGKGKKSSSVPRDVAHYADSFADEKADEKASAGQHLSG